MNNGPMHSEVVPTQDRILISLSSTDWEALNTLLFELEEQGVSLDSIFEESRLAISPRETQSLRNLWSRLNGAYTQ